jgi:hypothetical protein
LASCGSGSSPVFHRGKDLVVVHFRERVVVGVMVLFHGVVVSSVVAADVGPAGRGGAILIGTVEEIAVKKKSVAGLHLAIDEREAIEESLDSLGVGAGLVADLLMVDSARLVRPT